MEDNPEVLAWMEMRHMMEKHAFRAKTSCVLNMLIWQYPWRYIDHQIHMMEHRERLRLDIENYLIMIDFYISHSLSKLKLSFHVSISPNQIENSLRPQKTMSYLSHKM